MTAEELRQEILEKTAEYYRLVHKARQDAEFEPGKSRVNYAGRVFDEREMQNLVDSSLEFWLTYGRWSKKFEKGLADYLGVRFALLVNSGSSANLLAFMTLTSPLLGERRVRRGDEVITVAAGFPTTIAPIVQYGAVPVFVDVDLGTANIDVAKLEAAVSPRTKAVMLAHTLGNPFDARAVKAFCDRHGLWLVEDNCDALGSKFAGRFTGTWGDLGTSSFYPPHHMTMGEGGAVYTSDPVLKKIALSMRDWGRDCWCESGVDNTCGCRFTKQFGSLPLGYDHKYVYSHFGYNLKATDMQAAVGCAQLEKFPSFVEKRKANFDRLYAGLHDLPQLRLFAKLPEADPSWFGFLMTVLPDAGFSRNDLAKRLEGANIQTRNLFAGNILRHPCFEHLAEGVDYRVAGTLDNTDTIMNSSLWIGLYPGMGDAKLDHMIATIRNFCGR
ncbi:MAG: lipopolysaccharide biosynthesis protein RfbH [Kiritimatiellae bacterium]|nr:lipopolysaccharide biosynthesis protein RfbH [Kiritimatiellia bacterium]